MTEEDMIKYFTDQPAEYYQKFLDAPPPRRLHRNLQASKEQQALTTAGARPKYRIAQNAVPVYAFYAPRRRNMPAKELDLIDRWKQAWSAKGYDPIVLTIQDAQEHPEFPVYAQAIDFLIDNADRKWDAELRDCYFRYLAIASKGGGLMVDLDTTPKDPANSFATTTPNTFTLQCGFNTPDPKQDWLKQVETQNGLPCVAMGSEAEWMRVAKVLGWVSKHHDNIKVWTDMQSLMFLERYSDIDLLKVEKAQSWRTRGFDKCYFRYV